MSRYKNKIFFDQNHYFSDFANVSRPGRKEYTDLLKSYNNTIEN